MKRSTDCILTTHMGSLPRPDVLADLLVAQAEGRPVDAARVPAPDVLPVCLQVKAGALCLPFANPRHSHEVDAFRTQKLPDHMILVCRVVETTHNYVEHPLVIAERLERAVRAVGDCERVMAGTDCGFGTIVGDTQVSESGPSSRQCATARQSRASGSGVDEAVMPNGQRLFGQRNVLCFLLGYPLQTRYTIPLLPLDCSNLVQNLVVRSNSSQPKLPKTAVR